jgi:hypothetical protein
MRKVVRMRSRLDEHNGHEAHRLCTMLLVGMLVLLSLHKTLLGRRYCYRA